MREQQKKEIETIKPRTYMLNLSDADVERIESKAMEYGMTVSKLLENFIGDLIDGTYSNGSDERMYANQWFNRCCFEPVRKERNLITFCNGMDALFYCSGEELISKLERVNEAKKEIENEEKEIENPSTDWKDIRHWNPVTDEYFPAYKNLEEYIKHERECLESYKNDLKEVEEEIEDVKEDFAKYMGEKTYSWEKELDAFVKWYNEETC